MSLTLKLNRLQRKVLLVILAIVVLPMLGAADPVLQPVTRISRELGITFVQVYTPQQQLIYSSVPVRMGILWERGQTEAVLKVGYKGTNQLAAVGITPVPRSGAPRYYLIMGSLLNQDFIN